MKFLNKVCIENGSSTNSPPDENWQLNDWLGTLFLKFSQCIHQVFLKSTLAMREERVWLIRSQKYGHLWGSEKTKSTARHIYGLLLFDVMLKWMPFSISFSLPLGCDFPLLALQCFVGGNFFFFFGYFSPRIPYVSTDSILSLSILKVVGLPHMPSVKF